MTERELQDSVTALCRLLGLPVYHTRDSRKSAKGWPDLAICGTRLIFRELKDATRKVTPEQEAWGRWLTAAGQHWDVWRPADWHSGQVRRELEAIRVTVPAVITIRQIT
jgi:hypothetical protein